MTGEIVIRRWKPGRILRENLARALQVFGRPRDGRRLFRGVPRCIVVLLPHGLGDATLLTPLLRALRCRFPAAALHLVAFTKDTHDFFAGDPHATAVHGPATGIPTTILALRRGGVDVLYNPKDHPSRSFLLLAHAIGAGYRIGHDVPLHRGLFDYLLDVDYHAPMAIKHLAALGAFGNAAREDEHRPYIPPAPVSPALSHWLATSTGAPLTGLNISAGKPDRLWTDTAWARLIEECADHRFAVLAAPADRERKRALEAAPNVAATPDTCNLYEASLIIGRLRLLVSPDTALVHVASSTGTPVVGLYTNARHNQTRFGPFLVPHEIVASSTSRVGDIPVEDVAAAMRRVAGL